MQKKVSPKKIVYYLILGLVIIGARHYINKNKTESTPEPVEINIPTNPVNREESIISSEREKILVGIDELTAEEVVVKYVKKHGELPAYYLTKAEARKQGWVAHEGNLCEVLPGKAIGGDHFGNREGLLPRAKGRKYVEADLNYHCGQRNSDRLVFSNDGLVYVTKDHYRSFQKQ